MHWAWKVPAFVWRVKKGGKLYSRGKVKVESKGCLEDGLLGVVVDAVTEGTRVVADCEKAFEWSKLVDILLTV